MYSIANVHGINTLAPIPRRILQTNDTPNNGIYITGNGVAGLFVVFLLTFFVIFVISFMHSVFVNTKLVEKSLLVGRIDG